MGTEGANYVDIDLSNIRKVIARRLTESKVRLKDIETVCGSGICWFILIVCALLR